jgi:hypothetical protein
MYNAQILGETIFVYETILGIKNYREQHIQWKFKGA